MIKTGTLWDQRLLKNLGRNYRYVHALPNLLTKSLFFVADLRKNHRIPNPKTHEYEVKNTERINSWVWQKNKWLNLSGFDVTHIKNNIRKSSQYLEK
jgi:hypothetical protein